MKAIGGYFELELNYKQEYHHEALRLNTGRNAFEYILLAYNYKKVYLPFFTCDVLLEPLKKHQIAFEFYSIDANFEPLFKYDQIQPDETFLYTNYFGLKEAFIIDLAKICENLIIDSAQSFFSKPISGIATFYSARKFFGVPDGAYLYCDKILDNILEKDISFDRCSHLLKRLDCGAESGYENFISNDASLNNQEIKEMSTLSQSLLCTVDYESNKAIRIENFNFLHHKLQATNKLKIDSSRIGVPMLYPYWSNEINLKDRLLEFKIYTPVFWKSVKSYCNPISIEYQFTDELVYLPIDQRYNEKDLNRIVRLVL